MENLRLKASGWGPFLSTGLLLSITLSGFSQTSIQDSISSRDASEIRYKAEKLVRTELNELLNALSNSGYETQEVAESIHAAYSESRNRIFRDSLVTVEPDLNPAVRSSAQSGDEPVGKYLKDIDILYRKSNLPTVQLSNIRCSPVKKNDNIYVKVYFQSHFTGNSTVSDEDYAVMNRIAEISAGKEGNQWRLYIVRLAFFDPADTIGDVGNNMPIKYDRLHVTGISGEAGEPAPGETGKGGEAKATPAQLAAALVDKGRMQENNRQYKEAIENYQGALRLDPGGNARLQPRIRELTNRYAMLSGLQAKYDAGYVKEALKDYTEAIRRSTGNSDYYLGRGRCYEKLNEPKSLALAIKDYTQAYDLDHNNLAALRCRAELYARMGDNFKALTDYIVYITVNRSDIAAYERKSEIHLLLKLNADAISDLDEALAVDPGAASVYYRKGLLLFDQNKEEKAWEDFDSADR